MLQLPCHPKAIVFLPCLAQTLPVRVGLETLCLSATKFVMQAEALQAVVPVLNVPGFWPRTPSPDRVRIGLGGGRSPLAFPFRPNSHTNRPLRWLPDAVIALSRSVCASNPMPTNLVLLENTETLNRRL